MKHRLSFIILFLFVSLRFSAQVIENGYYRVSNVGSGRYVYVKDNTGSINVQAATAEMGALELWKDHSKTYYDPSSIIFIYHAGTSDAGEYYDLQAQGTGVHKIIGYHVYIDYSRGSYQVYAEGHYLWDVNIGNADKGRMGTQKRDNANYKRWSVSKVNNSDEYFGVKPTLKVGNRYFCPFYADFGFSLLGEGMKVWVVKEVNQYAVVITPFNGNVVPASTPVIIECTSNVVSNNKLNIVYNKSKTGQTNKLAGVYFNNEERERVYNSAAARTEFDKKTMRVLGVTTDGKLGYILSTVAVDAKTGYQYLEANQSYLPVPSGLPDEIPVMTESEYEEWKIAADVPAFSPDERIVTVYQLSGRSVGKVRSDELNTLPAGIYIIDNKKVVIK